MFLNLHRYGLGVAALLLTAGLTTPASAQDRDQGDQGDADQPTTRSQGRQPGRSAQNRGQGRQRGQSGQTDVRLVPEGWVRVGTDTDGDGRFDRVETIYVFDLEEARARSASRRQGGQDQGQSQNVHIEGKVRDMMTHRLAGMGEDHQFARVETESGRTAKVDLGPKSQVSELNLKDGDKITVTGTRGTINDRGVLMAAKVEKGDQSVTLKWPHDRNFTRVRGEILRTRTSKFRNRDGEHVVAQMRLRSGRTADVILGPKSQLSDVDLEEGSRLSLLVHPGRLNGNSAFVADAIRCGDQTIQIERESSKGRLNSVTSRSNNQGSEDSSSNRNSGKVEDGVHQTSNSRDGGDQP